MEDGMGMGEEVEAGMRGGMGIGLGRREWRLWTRRREDRLLLPRQYPWECIFAFLPHRGYGPMRKWAHAS